MNELVQMSQCLKVSVVYEGIHRADNDGSVFCDVPFIMQVGTGERNGREGVSAAGLIGDIDLFPQLVGERRMLLS